MRARYYNVSIKRFINQDVVTGNIAESQSLNRYAYVEGNPVSYFDPFGLEKANSEELHNILGVISTGAFIIGLCATGGGIVAAGAFAVGAVSNGINGGLYLNDAINAETEERYENIENFGWNLLGIGTGAMSGVDFNNPTKMRYDIAANIKGTIETIDYVVAKIKEIVKKYVKQWR